MTELLSDIEIDEALTGLREWRRDDDGLVRTVESQSFPDAIDLVRRVADEAELADHHPDIDIRYTSVTYRLSTHSVPGHPGGGITGKDVLLAAAIDRLAG
ncbi:MAG: 4a-hydroxytetrahydrobiopterin dehydratase [Rhodococcus sp. (in: high G+C Gram-positive bacteria)]